MINGQTPKACVQLYLVRLRASRICRSPDGRAPRLANLVDAVLLVLSVLWYKDLGRAAVSCIMYMYEYGVETSINSTMRPDPLAPGPSNPYRPSCSLQ